MLCNGTAEVGRMDAGFGLTYYSTVDLCFCWTHKMKVARGARSAGKRRVAFWRETKHHFL